MLSLSSTDRNWLVCGPPMSIDYPFDPSQLDHFRPVLLGYVIEGLPHPHGRPGHTFLMCPTRAVHPLQASFSTGDGIRRPQQSWFPSQPFPAPSVPAWSLCGRSYHAHWHACRLSPPARWFVGIEVRRGLASRACAVAPSRPHRAGNVTRRLDGEQYLNRLIWQPCLPAPEVVSEDLS